jgi:hypothetical protein
MTFKNWDQCYGLGNIFARKWRIESTKWSILTHFAENMTTYSIALLENC